MISQNSWVRSYASSRSNSLYSRDSFCKWSITNFSVGTAIEEFKSYNSDPEGECDLDDDLEIPAEFINEYETKFQFVSFTIFPILRFPN